MKYSIKIQNVKTIDEVEKAWSTTDYRNLLEKFDYPDTQSINDAELKDYLFMAISDFEPNEAAAVLLEYKLSDHLNEGQIDSLSHEMLLDKISEEYPNIFLHATLFDINQLLYKAYNGTFLNAKATVIEFELTPLDESKDFEVTKEIVLKCLVQGFSPSNLINRLFPDQLISDETFTDAEGIVWYLTNENNTYKLTTSEYWINKEDVINGEFDAEIAFSIDDEEE
ncbi:MAG: hypothetical protein KBE41_09150 [Lutibacter sp.]|nr:hypothetical protein [Lutibacter sp.]MBP9601657.1 hypothetical protein [Lutibacter sp.]